jgi:uncharacterized membrane protein
MNTIIGIFDDAAAARRAMEALRDSPLPLDDISIVSRNTETGAAVANDDDVSAGEGAAVGAVWGGLVGLAALLIPGVGPFIAGGALFAALTGAVTGAVVGGIAAALIDFGGIPEEEARGYESMVHEGKTLVAVRANDEDSAEVRRMLDRFGAETVRDDQTTDTALSGRKVHVAMYDESGRRVDGDAAYSTTSSATLPRGIYDVPASSTFTTGTRAGTATRHGIYDWPEGSERNTYTAREVGGASDRVGSGTWTRGEVVGEGQGAGPRTGTGKYDADQWAGKGQEPGKTPGDTWTSGEVVGEGQGAGPRKDTGEYHADQWVGEGQGDPPTTSSDPKKR